VEDVESLTVICNTPATSQPRTGPEVPSPREIEHYEHEQDADVSFPTFCPQRDYWGYRFPIPCNDPRGLELSTLSNAGMDELNLLIVEPKLVALLD
jgi:hypothetical protein